MIACALLGAVGLFAAAKLIHHRHHRWHGYPYGGCGGGRRGRGGWGDSWGGDDDEPPPAGGLGRAGRRFVVRGLSDRLDASPEQERVLGDAADELLRAAETLKGEGRKTRQEIAAALRSPHFDEVRMGELFARHDTALEQVRRAFVGAGAKVHDTLDEQQRARLADMVESSSRFWRRRCHHHHHHDRSGAFPSW